MQAKKFKRKKPNEIGKDNEILAAKTKEVVNQEIQLKEMRKEIERIQHIFSTDKTYELMIETKNKIKADKQKLQQVRDENKILKQTYETSLGALEQTEGEKGKSNEIEALRDQVQQLTRKLKKLRFRAKDEDEKFAQYHKNAIIVEERCRNMQEIILLNKQKKKERHKQTDLQFVDELDQQYKTLLF